jgi:hypothetical protein
MQIMQENAFTAVHRNMPTVTKKLRLIFYVLATVELILVSVAWGRMSLH